MEFMVTERALPAEPVRQHPTGRPPVTNQVVLAGLRSPLHRLFDRGTVGLRYLSVVGVEVTLPVMYVRSEQGLAVLVGRSSTKQWWRHFRSRRPVDVWWHGEWRMTTAQAFAPGTPEHTAAAEAYGGRHPHITTSIDPFVLVSVPA